MPVEVHDRTRTTGLQRFDGGADSALGVVGFEQTHRNVEHRFVRGRDAADRPRAQERLVCGVGAGGAERELARER